MISESRKHEGHENMDLAMVFFVGFAGISCFRVPEVR